MNGEYGRNAVRLIRNATIVSFDMYGTLVHRAVVDPKDVFHMANVHTLFFQDYTDKNPHLHLPSLRIDSESQARTSCYATSNTREVTIREIYRELENRLQNTALVRRYYDAELLTEKRFTYSSRLHKALFKLAQSLGKKILIATDMYLDPKCIEEILAAQGYTKPYELYVSGYTCLPKYDASFFSYVQREIIQENDSFVHMGDSIVSDVKAPADAGLTALLYSRDTEQAKTHAPSIEASLACGISRYILDTHPKAMQSAALQLGVEVYGPLIFGYMLWLGKKLHEQNTEAVLFSLRDTQLILRLLKKYKAQLHIQQALIPLFISRKAIAEPAMFAYDNQYLQFFCSSDTAQSLESLCAALHITYFHYNALLHQCGLKDKDALVDVCDARLLMFLSQILPDLQGARLQNTHLVMRYMDSVCKEYSNLTYVDLGYRGTIPVYLFRLQKYLRPKRQYCSLMLAKNTYPHPDFEAQSFLQNVAHEYFENGFCELLECVLTSNQKSTTGYALTDTNSVHPKFSGTICKNTYALGKEVKAGVELFVDTALHFLDGYNFDALTGEGWADWYLRFVSNPRPSEAQLFVGFDHDPHVLARDTKKILSYTGDSASMRQNYADSLWKSGFTALSGRGYT